MKWAYGVTTVPDRFDVLLPRTLKSLEGAGFPEPRLFVDNGVSLPPHLRKYPATLRHPRVRTFVNWVLALWELYGRDPEAERYAIFQDDFVTYRNLRQYLEQCSYPKHGYLNLYTSSPNEKQFKGWYMSHQNGLGAVGLVFSNEAVRVLLASQHMVDRPLDQNRGWRAIDGGIVAAFRKAGWQEWVHNPSLIQHTGEKSSMGNRYQEPSPVFNGEDFDAMELVEKPIIPIDPSRPNRIGLVGYNCNTGLGELNRQIATYSEIDVWFVKPHSHYRTNPPHPNVETMSCPMGQTSKIERFLKAVDTVVFCEQPYYTDLIDLARKHKKRIVCIPMMEWMPPGARGWPQMVDLFLCPTLDCYEQFAHVVPCVYFPWPVDTTRFQFQRRDACHRFLYIGGHGGWQGRKGIEVMRRAKELWPEMPLAVRCQESTAWPSGTTILPSTDSNADLYASGDVLIVPHSVDGLGLEPMEAMSCGMPVITTNGKPWNEIPSIGKIAADSKKGKVRRPVTWYLPRPESIVEIGKRLIGENITAESEQARQWAESRDWARMASKFDSLVRYGTASPREVTLDNAG